MIARLQERNEQSRANAMRTLDAVAGMYKFNAAAGDDAVVKQYNALLENLNATVLDRFASTSRLALRASHS